MSEGARAYDIVNGYPQSDANYPKVIAALQERLDRPKLLKQVYVRELLKMVISNAKTGETTTLAKMFDRLESHLLALESLGITSDQTVEFLYPMVESILPEEILIAWQRSANYGRDGSHEDPPLNEMGYFMRFLRAEVESEEQRLLARTGFIDTSEKKQVISKEKKIKHKEKHSESIPTAYGIVAGQISGCLFCNKAHASQDCFKAQKLTVSERKDKVREKNHCFACLKPNHTAKNCKTSVKCILCGRRHHVIMCSEIETRGKKEEAKAATETENESIQSTLTSQIVCSPNVLLMTCLVKIKGSRDETRICRVLYDTGSHLTRVRSSAVKSLGHRPIKEKHLRIVVYGGGVITAPHSLFNLEIESTDGKVKRNIEAYDERTLCGAILPRIPKGPWLEELSKKGIRFNDFESQSNEVDVIVGSQYFQKFLTGCRVVSKYGYTAVETVFGWTLTGALNDTTDKEQSMATLVTSLAVNEADVTQL